MGLYIYCVVCHVSKESIFFCFITLNLYHKRLKYSYDITFFNGSTIRPIKRKCIVFGACEEVKAEKLFMCLLPVIHVHQYVKL